VYKYLDYEYEYEYRGHEYEYEYFKFVLELYSSTSTSTEYYISAKQYKLVPASAGGKVHHRSGVGYAGSHSADLAVVGQPAPLQHRSYLWLPLYSDFDVTSVTYATI